MAGLSTSTSMSGSWCRGQVVRGQVEARGARSIVTGMSIKAATMAGWWRSLYYESKLLGSLSSAVFSWGERVKRQCTLQETRKKTVSARLGSY